MSLYDITMKFALRDEFSGPLKKVASGVDSVRQKIQGMNSANDQLRESSRAAVADMAAVAVSLTAVTSGIAYTAGRASNALISSSREVELAVKNLQYNAQMGTEEFDKFQESLKRMATSDYSIHSLKQFQEAGYELLSFGLNETVTANVLNQHKKIQKSVAELAIPAVMMYSTSTRGLTDIAESSRIAGAAISKFGLDFSEVVSQDGRLVTQLDRFFDMASKASQLTGLKPEQMSNVMRAWKAAPGFFNISPETALAFTGHLITSGYTPDEAANSMQGWARSSSRLLGKVMRSELLNEIARNRGAKEHGAKSRMLTSFIEEAFGSKEAMEAALVEQSGKYADIFDFATLLEKKMSEKGLSHAFKGAFIGELFQSQQVRMMTSAFDQARFEVKQNIYEVDKWGNHIMVNGQKNLLFTKGIYHGNEAMRAMKAQIADSRGELVKYNDLIKNTGAIVSQALGGRWETFKSQVGMGLSDSVRSIQQVMISGLDFMIMMNDLFPGIGRYVSQAVGLTAAVATLAAAVFALSAVVSLAYGRYVEGLTRWGNLLGVSAASRGNLMHNPGLVATLTQTVLGIRGQGAGTSWHNVKFVSGAFGKHVDRFGGFIKGLPGDLSKFLHNKISLGKNSRNIEFLNSFKFQNKSQLNMITEMKRFFSTNPHPQDSMNFIKGLKGGMMGLPSADKEAMLSSLSSTGMLGKVKGGGWLMVAQVALSAVEMVGGLLKGIISKIGQFIHGVASVAYTIGFPFMMITAGIDVMKGLSKLSGAKFGSFREFVGEATKGLKFLGEALFGETGKFTAEDINGIGKFQLLVLKIINTGFFKHARALVLGFRKFAESIFVDTQKVVDLGVLSRSQIEGSALLGRGISAILGAVLGMQTFGPIGGLLGFALGKIYGGHIGAIGALISQKISDPKLHKAEIDKAINDLFAKMGWSLFQGSVIVAEMLGSAVANIIGGLFDMFWVFLKKRLSDPYFWWTYAKISFPLLGLVGGSFEKFVLDRDVTQQISEGFFGKKEDYGIDPRSTETLIQDYQRFQGNIAEIDRAIANLKKSKYPSGYGFDRDPEWNKLQRERDALSEELELIKKVQSGRGEIQGIMQSRGAELAHSVSRGAIEGKAVYKDLGPVPAQVTYNSGDKTTYEINIDAKGADANTLEKRLREVLSKHDAEKQFKVKAQMESVIQSVLNINQAVVGG